MAAVDQLLNVIGLVLWLSWRGAGRPPASRGAGTLLSNLKSANTRPPRRWAYLAALAGLILLRPLLYGAFAASIQWTPLLPLGSTALAFRADSLLRLELYSVLSFGWAWLVLQSWLLTLGLLVSGAASPADGWERAFRDFSGWPARLPRWLRPLVPSVLAGIGWAAACLPLARLGVLPGMPQPAVLAGQAAIVGLSVWLPLKWLLGLLLLLRLIYTYIYFATHPLWDLINRVGGRLLRPLHWLPIRFGKLDFTPLVAVALVWGLWWALDYGLARGYARLNL